MKKKFCRLFPVMLIFVCMIIFGGCEKEPQVSKPVKYNENFCHTAEITQGNDKFSAEIKRGGQGSWQWVFSKPETIENMTVTYSSDVAKVEFQGLSYALNKSNMPKNGMISLVCDALDTVVSQKQVKCVKQGDILTETGVVNGHDFTAVFNKDRLKSLEISKSLKIVFN